MKKEDLKTGMFITTRKNEMGLVILNFLHTDRGIDVYSDVLIYQHGGYVEIEDYDENLRLPQNPDYSIEHVFVRNINNISPATWDKYIKLNQI